MLGRASIWHNWVCACLATDAGSNGNLEMQAISSAIYFACMPDGPIFLWVDRK